MEHETKFSLIIVYSTHVWVAECNRHLLSNHPLMVAVVSSIPTRGKFIFTETFSNPHLSNLHRNVRIARLVLKTKISIFKFAIVKITSGGGYLCIRTFCDLKCLAKQDRMGVLLGKGTVWLSLPIN